MEDWYYAHCNNCSGCAAAGCLLSAAIDIAVHVIGLSSLNSKVCCAINPSPLCIIVGNAGCLLCAGRCQFQVHPYGSAEKV